MKLLRPRACAGSLFEITPASLKQRGIRGVILDLDNTLTPWAEKEVSPQAQVWVESLREAGLRVCLFSNNRKERGEALAKSLGLLCIFSARKPRKRAFRQALALLGTSPEETAVIGDQIFTDMLGGNRAGLYTILVPPLSKREFIGTRFMRLLEKIVWPFVVGDGRKDQWRLTPRQ